MDEVRRLIVSAKQANEAAQELKKGKTEQWVKKVQEGRAKQKQTKEAHAEQIRIKLTERLVPLRRWPSDDRHWFCYTTQRMDDNNFYAVEYRHVKKTGRRKVVRFSGFKRRIVAKKYAYRWYVRKMKKFQNDPELLDHILKGSCRRPWMAHRNADHGIRCYDCDKREKSSKKLKTAPAVSNFTEPEDVIRKLR